jgi:hypothetical protein
MRYLLGLDLGQAMDFSAVVVAERHAPPHGHRGVPHGAQLQATYDVRYIKRWALGTPYPAIVQDVATLVTHPPLAGDSTLLADFTGCGRPVLDMMRQQGLTPRGIAIHGGDRVTQDGMDYRVPKRDLAAVVACLLQQQRLRIAARLPETPILTQELLTFKVKIDPQTAHDAYSAWREQDHDDVVLALAMALWWGEQYGGKQAGVWGLRW